MPGTSTKAAQRNRIAQLADSVSQDKMVPMNHPIKKSLCGVRKLPDRYFKTSRKQIQERSGIETMSIIIKCLNDKAQETCKWNI